MLARTFRRTTSIAAQSLLLSLLASLGLILLSGTFAYSALPPQDANGFFTNVADRLLRSEFNLSLNQIQIFPTNQYTPALHRLLQVTANLYEATQTNYFPTVYRPRIAADSTNAPASFYIAGYEQIDGTAFLSRPWFTLDNLSDVLTNPPTQVLADGPITNYLYDINVYGIPVIIGAKKGHPNFNKIAVDTVVSVARKLLLIKDSPGDMVPKIGGTNQMFIIGITNAFAIQAWNSYSQSYPLPGRQIELWVSNNINSILLFDEIPVATNIGAANTIGINSGAWTGYQPNYQASQQSFRVAIYTNLTLLPDSVVHPAHTLPFEPVTQGTYDNDFTNFHGQISLCLSNRFNFYIVDTTDFASPKLIDVASLSDEITSLDVGLSLSNCVASAASRYIRDIWNFSTQGTITRGVNNQLLVSATPTAASDSEWTEYSQGGVSNRLYVIDKLRVFVGLRPQTYNTTDFPPTNMCPAGFTPWTRFRHRKMWEVNDPLVHSITNDLVVTTNSVIGIKANEYVGAFTGLTNFQLFTINKTYRPWGYDDLNPLAYEVMIRDPLVMGSDDWDFPTGQTPLSCLGQIHRGTPWQTIYLKAATTAYGYIWLYPYGPGTTLETHPTNDWRLVTLLATIFNTNPPMALLSINQTNPVAWTAALNGLTVVSNMTLPDVSIPITLQISSNSPQAYVLADAIAQSRATQPGQYFHSLGDILATPELSTRSPWINWTDFTLKNYLDDFAYEALPRQLLPMLRDDPVLQINPAASQFLIKWPAFPDQLFEIQDSSDLVHWDKILTNIAPNQPYPLPTQPNPQPNPTLPHFLRAKLTP